MIYNSTNINKVNNYLSHEAIEHKKPSRHMTLEFKVNTMGMHNKKWCVKHYQNCVTLCKLVACYLD